MQLRLYDTLTRQKRPFVPLDPNNVRMYVCGPTVYDFAHIGNARPVIVFDVLFRLLRHLYGADHVTYVRNITDVDDKINDRAKERIVARGEVHANLNAEIRSITEETYRDFEADVKALGSLPPTFEPRATEYIRREDGKDMISLIEALIRNDNAYEASGHILFHVPSMPDYGKLSRRSLDEMEAGARVEVAPYKRDPMDFVLWKPSQPDEPGWDSPWGRGRPGWHIECSAMSAALLGKEFDIHGGGVDLIFPHHENELAQSRCAFHTKAMANYWMHNGFLQVEGEKMSKSLGNFVTIRDLLADWPGEVLRLNMLKTHYRSPIDWTLKGLKESQRMLEAWMRAVANVSAAKKRTRPNSGLLKALSDDLSVSDAIAELHELAKFSDKSAVARDNLYSNLVFLGLLPDHFGEAKRIADNVARDVGLPSGAGTHTLAQYRPQIEQSLIRYSLTLPSSANSANTVATAYRILNHGVFPYGFLDHWKRYHRSYLSEADRQHVQNTIGIEELNRLIEERLKARDENDFEVSDNIRKKLSERRILLKDSRNVSASEPPTTWEIAR
jgi:cysteinyl-tRNA synthetase